VPTSRLAIGTQRLLHALAPMIHLTVHLQHLGGNPMSRARGAPPQGTDDCGPARHPHILASIRLAQGLDAGHGAASTRVHVRTSSTSGESVNVTSYLPTEYPSTESSAAHPLPSGRKFKVNVADPCGPGALSPWRSQRLSPLQSAAAHRVTGARASFLEGPTRLIGSVAVAITLSSRSGLGVAAMSRSSSTNPTHSMVDIGGSSQR
jgi:hypothetical protein